MEKDAAHEASLWQQQLVLRTRDCAAAHMVRPRGEWSLHASIENVATADLNVAEAA